MVLFLLMVRPLRSSDLNQYTVRPKRLPNIFLFREVTPYPAMRLAAFMFELKIPPLSHFSSRNSSTFHFTSYSFFFVLFYFNDFCLFPKLIKLKTYIYIYTTTNEICQEAQTRSV